MADAAVIVAMRHFKAQLLAQEQAVMREMSRRWLDLERSLEGEIEALALQLDAMRRDGQNVSQAAVFRLERYQRLLAQVRTEWSAYQEFAEGTIAQARRRAGQLAGQHSVAALEILSPGISATFTRLPREAIENIIGLVTRQPLAELLAQRAVEAGMVDDLTQALVRGVGLGRNPRRVAREMRDALSGGLNKALQIARTEPLRAYRETQRQQYAATGVVPGYYRLATHDDRVCAACLAADGEFIPLGEVMREHPQGRCAQVPQVEGFDPPQWTKGLDWFQDQPAATQQAILGPGRYDAWTRNEFDFGDLVSTRRDSTWGDSIYPTPLRELVTAGG